MENCFFPKYATERSRSFNDIVDVWLFTYNGEPNLKAATTDEVAVCQWMTVPEIRALYEQGKLVPSLDYFFDAVERERIP